MPRALIWIGAFVIALTLFIGIGLGWQWRANVCEERAACVSEKFGEMYDWRDVPKEDVALALSLYLRKLHGPHIEASDYSNAVHCYMLLGCRTGAQDLYREAKSKGLVNADLRASATTWGL